MSSHEENRSLCSCCHPEGIVLAFTDGTKAKQITMSGDLESRAQGCVLHWNGQERLWKPWDPLAPSGALTQQSSAGLVSF